MSATGNEVEKAMEKDFNAMLNDLATRCYMMGYEAAKKEIIHCEECIKKDICADYMFSQQEEGYCAWAARNEE